MPAKQNEKRLKLTIFAHTSTISAQQIADIDLFYRSRVRQKKISSPYELIGLIMDLERNLHFKRSLLWRVCGNMSVRS